MEALTQAYTGVYKHDTNMHEHVCTHTHARMHTHTHTQMHTNTCEHTHIHMTDSVTYADENRKVLFDVKCVIVSHVKQYISFLLGPMQM